MTNLTTAQTPNTNIAPVEHDGVRYLEDQAHEDNGDQSGGYLLAVDIKSEKPIWRLKVYVTHNDPGAPTALDCYFHTMRLMADGAALEMVNDFGRVYRVDLATRTATQIGGPPEHSPTEAVRRVRRPHQEETPPAVEGQPKQRWFGKFF